MTKAPDPMTDHEPVLLEITDFVATITLNRPDRSNAIDLSTARRLADVIAEIERSHARVVLLRAKGDTFCVGGDLTVMAAAPDTGSFLAELATEMHRAVLRLHRLDIPVVAAVQGAVAGAGLGLVLAADLVVAADSSRFRTAYSGVGLTPDCGVTYWLPRAIGSQRALAMLMFNRVIDAETAREWGLVGHVVPAGELEEQATAMAEGIAAGPFQALGQSRRLVRDSVTRSLTEQLDVEAEAIARAAAGADAQGRIAAFIGRH
ncbi:enoyl-CoA hydratase/isomerase family protein [Nocardia sp. NPDC004860]|uniref:enoyl-CoA hydratase/isomerase family protein n=1 Tax=Nocardia sp. NPDC004860 TaxID=3154557 RepID=UPI0033B163B2